MSPGKIPTFHPQRPYVESNDDPSFRKRVLSPLSYKGMCIISLAPSRRWESNPPIPAYEAGAHPRKPRRRGATSRSRTGDLIRTKDALFQLSYGGVDYQRCDWDSNPEGGPSEGPLHSVAHSLSVPSEQAFVEGLEPPASWSVATRSRPTELHEHVLRRADQNPQRISADETPTPTSPAAPPTGSDPVTS